MFVLFRPVIQLQKTPLSKFVYEPKTLRISPPTVHRIEKHREHHSERKKKKNGIGPHVLNLGEALRNSHGLKERAQAPPSPDSIKAPSDRPKIWHPLPWATTAGRASLLAPEVSLSVRREEPGGERVMFTS